MKEIYQTSYIRGKYKVKVTYYLFADKSVYRLEELYLGNNRVRKLLCKALNRISDYKKWAEKAYAIKGNVFFDCVYRKATNTLDFMKTDNGQFSVCFEPDSDLIFVLKGVNDGLD